MSIIVFLGPTLSGREARTCLSADIRPPASRGDVYLAAKTDPWAIGIVDGYFHRVPSVLHKEILWAMSRGIHVYGASSMGALRATELATFGMVGVGSVFNAFRSGDLTDDDEVAVVHGSSDAGYVAGSDALVNIRATLALARSSGVIDSATQDALIEIAKDTFYPERRYDRIIGQGIDQGVARDQCERLLPWLPDNQVDVKRDDALAMLHRMGADYAASQEPHPASFRFNSTFIWENVCRSLDRRPAEDFPGVEETIGNELHDELRLQQLSARALEKQRTLSHWGLASPSLADAGVSEPELWRWYFEELLGGEVPADLEAYAVQHEFSDRDGMRRAVLRELLYRKKTKQPVTRG